VTLAAQVADAVALDPGALAALARRAAAARAFGAHGLRRAGEGEAFWQYREHRAEDGVRAVDWRRSARSDRLYARDRERAAPCTLRIWSDTRPAMAWRSGEALPTKAARALVLALALAVGLRAGGERATGFGAGPGGPGLEALAAGLIDAGADAGRLGEPIRGRDLVLVASDGIEPPDLWAQRLARIGPGDGARVMLLVNDPAEEDFPFTGRVLFEAPGSGASELVGRAEARGAGYRRAFEAHRAGVIAAAQAARFSVVTHRTDAPPGPVLDALAAALDLRRAP
jgi:uncharacterized protein (DUF58 family)